MSGAAWAEAAFLGLLKGLAKFLPVSSSAHLRTSGHCCLRAATRVRRHGDHADRHRSGCAVVFPARAGSHRGVVVAIDDQYGEACRRRLPHGLVDFGWHAAVFMKYVSTHSYLPFVAYRIMLGLLVFALLSAGILHPL